MTHYDMRRSHRRKALFSIVTTSIAFAFAWVMGDLTLLFIVISLGIPFLIFGVTKSKDYQESIEMSRDIREQVISYQMDEHGLSRKDAKKRTKRTLDSYK